MAAPAKELAPGPAGSRNRPQQAGGRITGKSPPVSQRRLMV